MKAINDATRWAMIAGVTLAASLSLQGSLTPAFLEATLHPGESVIEKKCVTIPALPPRVDVLLSFDLTGSMGGIIDTAKAEAINLINTLAASGVDFNYAVVSYMDYTNTYSSCGYSASYGQVGPDHAYLLVQKMTNNPVVVQAAINSLSLGWGNDGAQDYTRIFYESYADPGVAWRAGAKRIHLNFGDNVPHDCDLTEGTGIPGPWSTGGDPGRDAIMGTPDDLDLQTVLMEMAANSITLLEAHTGGDLTGGLWVYWTGLTGGQVFDSTAGDFVAVVAAEILSAAETPVVDGLTLAASSGFGMWITGLVPPVYDGVIPGETRCFDLTLTVPDGTAEGDVMFTVSAVDKAGVSYGDQRVLIHVIVNQPPDCSEAVPSVLKLWPPNHQWVPIDILGVTDPDGDPITVTIEAIWQDEPVNTVGEGNFTPDGTGIGTSTALLRAERSGTKKVPGDGRVYHLKFSASDGRGGTCWGEVLVGVPHDVKDTPIDGGPLYDSTLP